MSHKQHCDTCFSTNCLDTSCPLICCPNGCLARMHECKRTDHEHICPNVFIPCINVNYGCPSVIQRSQLTRHLRICPASVTVCSYTYNHEFQLNNLQLSPNENLIQTIAYRDNVWIEHLRQNREKELKLNPRKKPIPNVEKLIRSQKYLYITMPECMLSRTDGIICSACRIHLRQLEENEDQRISQLSQEDQKMMAAFNLQYRTLPDKTTSPSLVQMSSTLINSTDISVSSTPSSSNSITESLENEPLPVIVDSELPSSYLYRLNYFSSNKPFEDLKSFVQSPRFSCNAICRRDEIEHHWLIHFNIDCILNTSFTQQCPKSAYGCTFQYERLEPCRNTGQSIETRFDKMNDAISFLWYPLLTDEQLNENSNLLQLPSEILTQILLHLDSLSLRNISLVSRRLRALCQNLLPSRGIIVAEYERTSLTHGDITWTERKKHWLFSNTTSSVPKWQLKVPNKSTSLNQHLITCPYGETKDLQKEPPFLLVALSNSKPDLKPP